MAGSPVSRPPVPGPPPLAKILGAVVAPTTLLTALLYYFGWDHAYYFFNYFGLNSTVLGFTTVDYMMRSVDALFVPITVTAFAALLALWGHSALRARFAAGSSPAVLRILLPATAIGGLVLAAGGLTSYFTATALDEHLAAAPLSFTGGVFLLAYAVHLRRSLDDGNPAPGRSGPSAWAALAEWSALFAVVGIGLFGAATDYAAAVGVSRARQFVAGLPAYPNVVVYSDRALSLDASGVTELRCHDPNAAYRFRYDGLKLMLQSGGQYLFVPAAWNRVTGVAVLLPQSSSVRLEFYPASARPSHPAC